MDLIITQADCLVFVVWPSLGKLGILSHERHGNPAVMSVDLKFGQSGGWTCSSKGGCPCLVSGIASKWSMDCYHCSKSSSGGYLGDGSCHSGRPGDVWWLDGLGNGLEMEWMKKEERRD